MVGKSNLLLVGNSTKTLHPTIALRGGSKGSNLERDDERCRLGNRQFEGSKNCLLEL